MEASHGPADAEWFRQMANGSAVVFFILRVQPDVAFEFLTDAVEPRSAVQPPTASPTPPRSWV